MSKGSSYWGTARGKIGNTVVSVVKGQRIERAYQPSVSNPRTTAQQLQRARFANCVKFYKHANQNLFKFAFEDRKQTESDYNAFMRYNTSSSSAVLKKSQVNGTYPALANYWILTSGSLGEPNYISGDEGVFYLDLPSADGSAQTIGAVSKALINDEGLQNGDIITIVRISTSILSLGQDNPSHYPTWTIKQFIVAEDDETSLASIDAHIRLETSEGLYLDTEQRDTAYYYAVVYSRNTSGGILVSTTRTASNAIAQSLYLQTTEDTWQDQALRTWQSSVNSLLSGTEVSASITGYILTCGGDSVPRLSDTTLDTNVTSKATLTGTNLDKLSISDFSGVGLRVSGLTIISAEEAEITITGTGSHPYSWILYHSNRVIAQHSQVSATITSVTPSSIDVLGDGDTAMFVIKGDLVDALKVTDFTSSDEHLVIAGVTASSSNQTILQVAANHEVTSATISYKGEVIIQVSEDRVTITSQPVTKYAKSQQTLQITGTGLNTLSSSSFSKPSGWVISAYTASSDGTTATMVVVPNTDGELKYAGTLILKITSDNE